MNQGFLAVPHWEGRFVGFQQSKLKGYAKHTALLHNHTIYAAQQNLRPQDTLTGCNNIVHIQANIHVHLDLPTYLANREIPEINSKVVIIMLTSCT